jgi:hypothetical protein
MAAALHKELLKSCRMGAHTKIVTASPLNTNLQSKKIVPYQGRSMCATAAAATVAAAAAAVVACQVEDPLSRLP